MAIPEALREAASEAAHVEVLRDPLLAGAQGAGLLGILEALREAVLEAVQGAGLLGIPEALREAALEAAHAEALRDPLLAGAQGAGLLGILEALREAALEAAHAEALADLPGPAASTVAGSMVGASMAAASMVEAVANIDNSFRLESGDVDSMEESFKDHESTALQPCSPRPCRRRGAFSSARFAVF